MYVIGCQRLMREIEMWTTNSNVANFSGPSILGPQGFHPSIFIYKCPVVQQVLGYSFYTSITDNT